VVHQVASDLIARVGDATRPSVGPRLQQQLGRFDSMRGDHEYLADRTILAAVRTLDDERGDPAVFADFHVRHDGLGHELGAGPLSLRDMGRRVVLGLDGADRNAAAAAAASGPIVVALRVTGLRRRLHGVGRGRGGCGDASIGIAERDGGQRIRLATQIGSQLRGVLYVLDEPSIGLHPRDNQRLLETLHALRDLGNTVLVVEHDAETIEQADYVVDLGPLAGTHGGEVIAIGRPKDIEASLNSLTGKYLSGELKIEVPDVRRLPNGSRIKVKGARAYNLKNIDAEFPLGLFTVVTGVSGSGKSTLVEEILYPALYRYVYKSAVEPLEHDKVEGLELVDKVIEIDQTPIGRTPRSNPATYTGLFTPLRELYAMLPESRTRGYKAGRFSFNVKGGRCEACEGDGMKRIEMNFLPDVYVTCDVCRGHRYNRETLAVRYKGLSIADLLDTTIEDALPLLENIPQIKQKLETLLDVGLGYIKIGQSSTTLSGGEAQRIKLAKELSKRATGKTIYILDEPTTGLHFADVHKLLEVLQRLVDTGNTVIVIEHNLDVIKSADYIIDLGPEGGSGGGKVVATGTPEEVARVKKSYTGQALKGVL